MGYRMVTTLWEAVHTEGTESTQCLESGRRGGCVLDRIEQEIEWENV